MEMNKWMEMGWLGRKTLGRGMTEKGRQTEGEMNGWAEDWKEVKQKQDDKWRKR